MKRQTRLLILLTVTVILSTIGCGLFTKSPSDVVKTAYMAANEGNYSEADKYLASEVINALKGGLGPVSGGGAKGLWDEITRKRTIDKVEIVKEEIRGDVATVSYKIYYKDGSNIEESQMVVKERGDWKVNIR